MHMTARLSTTLHLTLIVLAVGVSAFLSGCSVQSSDSATSASSTETSPSGNQYVGKWEGKRADGKAVWLFLESDGAGAFFNWNNGGYALSWSADGDGVAITPEGSALPAYRASVQGDTLLSVQGSGASQETLSWTRSAKDRIPSRQAIVGKWQSRVPELEWAGSIEFTSDGALYIDGQRVGRYLLTDLGQLSVVSDAGQTRQLGNLRTDSDGLVWHTYENQGLDTPFAKQ